MPYIPTSSYTPPAFYFRNGHLNTIYGGRLRRVEPISYKRERMDTPDDDFIDLDWSRMGSTRLVVLLHGLEGSTERSYMYGMVRAFNRRGWDVVGKNFRTCSGEMNHQLRAYHGGVSDDLHTVIQHITKIDQYQTIVLIGFSLGGNVILKYLGEQGEGIHSAIKKAVAFSVPCDFLASSEAMMRFSNRIYVRYFLTSLYQKMEAKRALIPDQVPAINRRQMRTLYDFDHLITAPLHGFEGAEDYYRKVSCKPFLSNIRIPTLLVNAWDDPFLAGPCYPIEEAKESVFFHLETPAFGGHVGFVSFNKAGEYWLEQRACQFVETLHS